MELQQSVFSTAWMDIALFWITENCLNFVFFIFEICFYFSILYGFIFGLKV